MQALQYSPGQLATIFLETLDSTGARADGYALPLITRVITPSLSLDPAFPQNMIKLDVGLYYFQYTLASGATGVGSYLVDIIYADPDTMVLKNTAVQLVVNAPFGNYSAVVTVGG
jgi:hypothetical protein